MPLMDQPREAVTTWRDVVATWIIAGVAIVLLASYSVLTHNPSPRLNLASEQPDPSIHTALTPATRVIGSDAYRSHVDVTIGKREALSH